MAISQTPAIERIARVLAGQRLSANAKGDVASASAEVDAHWRDYEDDAFAVLRTLREPDAAIAQAGDPALWEAMVLAALGGTGTLASSTSYDPPAPGNPTFHEGP